FLECFNKCSDHNTSIHDDVTSGAVVVPPIRSVSMELSRLSGYEEVKCSVRDVFPSPHVTWSTEPPTFHDLRPMTRKHLDPSGLYELESRLRTLGGQADLIYICTATSPYGGPAWTASYRHRGTGKDLTLPCFAPSYLNSDTLSWTFSNSDDPFLSADTLQEWVGHVELDGYRVPFGDGSLRLMDPDEERHTGRYLCEFNAEMSRHTERLEVTISGSLCRRTTHSDGAGQDALYSPSVEEPHSDGAGQDALYSPSVEEPHSDGAGQDALYSPSVEDHTVMELVRMLSIVLCRRATQ
uniref:Ig-like domain-containing protein n=1 Tax=Neogobius melanostomus TaxID=47308 RepID=A0A8C6SZI7_9GOBI